VTVAREKKKREKTKKGTGDEKKGGASSVWEWGREVGGEEWS